MPNEYSQLIQIFKSEINSSGITENPFLHSLTQSNLSLERYCELLHLRHAAFQGDKLKYPSEILLHF